MPVPALLQLKVRWFGIHQLCEVQIALRSLFK